VLSSVPSIRLPLMRALGACGAKEALNQNLATLNKRVNF